MSTWRCGHPRTPENTKSAKPNGRCRQCRHVSDARYRKTEKCRIRNERYENTYKAMRTRGRYASSLMGMLNRKLSDYRRMCRMEDGF